MRRPSPKRRTFSRTPTCGTDTGLAAGGSGTSSIETGRPLTADRPRPPRARRRSSGRARRGPGRSSAAIVPNERSPSTTRVRSAPRRRRARSPRRRRPAARRSRSTFAATAHRSASRRTASARYGRCKLGRRPRGRAARRRPARPRPRAHRPESATNLASLALELGRCGRSTTASHCRARWSPWMPVVSHGARAERSSPKRHAGFARELDVQRLPAPEEGHARAHAPWCWVRRRGSCVRFSR